MFSARFLRPSRRCRGYGIQFRRCLDRVDLYSIDDSEGWRPLPRLNGGRRVRETGFASPGRHLPLPDQSDRPIGPNLLCHRCARQICKTQYMRHRDRPRKYTIGSGPGRLTTIGSRRRRGREGRLPVLFLRIRLERFTSSQSATPRISRIEICALRITVGEAVSLPPILKGKLTASPTIRRGGTLDSQSPDCFAITYFN